MAEFYVTEERAFAPGIAGEWPRVIPKPGTPHGRLVKVEGLGDTIEGAEKVLRHIVSGQPVDNGWLTAIADKLKQATGG